MSSSRRGITVCNVMITVMLAAELYAQGATVHWRAPNATVHHDLPFASLEFERPLTGTETVLGHSVLEWLDADYTPGNPPGYDDWIVNPTNSIDGNANEIWLRATGHVAQAKFHVTADTVSIHLLGDNNDGVAAVYVDGVLVAKLDMNSASAQTVLVIVHDLPVMMHHIFVRDESTGASDDVAILGAAALKNDFKWAQPPQLIPVEQVFNGWNEPSVTNRVPIAADDWVCKSSNPITKIRWWGSFADWLSNTPPAFRPNAFQITLWTDVPANPGVPTSFSHPGIAIWQTHCTNFKWQFAGWDYDPRNGQYEACFLFEQDLPANEWFYQEPGSAGTNIYWISIAGEYWQGTAGPWPWGWKTRPRDPLSPAPDAAVRITAPPPWLIGPGTQFQGGTPIYWPDPTQSWDMAFELISDFKTSGAKWEQRPDLSPLGMDVKDSQFPPPPVLLADDFRCTSPGPITNITIWGSWFHDLAPLGGSNVHFTLSLHADIPVQQSPTLYSMPGQMLRMWQFPPGTFAVSLLASNLNEGWFLPPETYTPQGDSVCYQYDFPIPPPEQFIQTGTPTQPVVYWLDCQAQVLPVPGAEEAQFGWKTCITNWNDTAVWVYGAEPYVFPEQPPWNRLLWMNQRPLDLAFRINSGGQSVHEIKWSQPPTPFNGTNNFNGWNEPSRFNGPQIVADDWVCADTRPISDIHWWGSFVGWQLPAPPETAFSFPSAFQFTIWTDVPVAAGGLGWSHPGTALWQVTTTNYALSFVGWDWDPRDLAVGPEACFKFHVDLRPDEWFYQEPGQRTNIHWISIAAVYPAGQVPQYPWGWKTRPRDPTSPAPDDAVRVFVPTAPALGSLFQQGAPIEFPTDTSWDMAFELTAGPEPATTDWGDAPRTYPTLAASNGAVHTIVPGLFIGARVDSEADGQPDANALGDDNNPPTGVDDEDGVTLSLPFFAGQYARFDVFAPTSNLLLSAWCDFGADGSWAQAGDQIFANAALGVGTNLFAFPVPATAVATNTFARFRVSTVPNLSYTGAAPDGEVEDYEVRIERLDFGDAPDPSYPTLLANNGARHILGPMFLGKLVDAELDGQPSADASGDDLNPPSGVDDEDGVVFHAALISGVPNTITVTTSMGGYLQAWLDANGDGDWADAGEQVITDRLLGPGANQVNFAVPKLPGNVTKTFMRFRLSGLQGLSYTGLAPDGEVEDYEVKIESLKWLQRPELGWEGVDVDNFWVQLADDFQCTQTGPVTDIHLWGSFVSDVLPVGGIGNMTFTLFLYKDVPAGADSTFSHPGELLWSRTFKPGEYSAGHAFYQPDGEWWHDPASPSWLQNADKNIFQFDFYLPPEQAFSQVEGTIYWLGVKYTAGANDGYTFGWKTTYEPWNDDACWLDTRVNPVVWREMRYGDGHPWAQLPPPANSLNLAFAVSGERGPAFDFGDAPDGAAAPRYPTLLLNNGARHTIVPGVRLGSLVDAEADGQPNATATGDDTSNAADEDGVVLFGSHMIPGGLTGVAVTASTNGYVSAWVDFSLDGSWATAGDQVFTNVWVTNGLNNLYFKAPFAIPRATNTFARFRFSTQPLTNFTGLAVDGEVEDYRWWIEAVDFGDAPDPVYPTKYANSGAYHWLLQGVFLGAVVDAEFDGQPNASATGDDTAGLADEDGVTLLTPLVPGAMGAVQVTASLGGAWLNAWVDFGADGSWATPGDQIIVNASPMAGPNIFNFPVPATAPGGSNVLARFRLSTAANLSFTNAPGQVPNGEVEDHQWRISQLDFGDAPDPKFPTLLANDGARHVIGPLFLGARADAENDGQPDVYAAGDDKNPPAGPNDEDGVSFPTALIANAPATIRVVSSGPGLLQGWFDFDGDGTWTNANEQPINNRPIVAGVNIIQIFVPNAVPGRSYARFRLSTQPNLKFTGLAPDGEVEDYAVDFQPLKWNQTPEQGPEGVDVYAGVPLADDFLCRQSGPITDIHLWGSFRNDLLPLGGAGSMNMTLTIYADVPAGPSFSHPGQTLWTRTFAPGQFSAGLCMANASEWYHDPRLPQPLWQARADTNIWQFDFYLAATNAFQQVSNTVYWLGVQYKPLDNDAGYLFGWKTTYLQWNDAACWFNPAAGSWSPLLYGDGHPRATQPPPMNRMDFAFALSGEPAEALDFGDAPDGLAALGYPTLLVNNGARHAVVQGLMLGNTVDAEANGQPDATATGDDNNLPAGVDDEDGVFFPLLVPGQLGTAGVNVTGTGFLNAWIDFAADGSWAQPGDQIATNLPVTTGAYGLWFTVPTNAPWGRTTFARFRLSTQPNLSFTGLAPDGEVEDHAMAISPLPGTDLGDAPDSSNSAGPPAVMTAYPGVQANFPTVFVIGSPPFGPIHRNPAVAFLGAGFSGEQEADMGPDQDFVNNLNPPADVADLDAFDDGLMRPVILPHCTSGLIHVFVTAPAPPQPLFLNAWFDWNRDGDWNDILPCPDGNPALEWAVQNIPAPAGAGLVPLPVIKAWHPSLDKKPLWIRITLSEIPVPGPLGWAGAGGDGPGGPGYQFGETEDYLLTDYDDHQQFDFGDAPSTYPVVLPNGARHLIVPNFHLGAQVTDPETDGLPHALALGDDLNNLADEDGVTLPTPLLVNTNGCVDVVLVGLAGGRLDAWMDFDHSGTWDATEQVLNAQPLANGSNVGLCFAITNAAKLGTNFARFRLSSLGGLAPTGATQDGEVEDYQVTFWQRRPTTNILITWIGVTNTAPTNQVVTVKWNAETNVHYEVLAAPSLGTNNGTDIVWSVISPEIIGPNNQHTHTNTSTSQRYYRVRAPWTYP